MSELPASDGGEAGPGKPLQHPSQASAPPIGREETAGSDTLATGTGVGRPKPRGTAGPALRAPASFRPFRGADAPAIPDDAFWQIAAEPPSLSTDVVDLDDGRAFTKPEMRRPRAAELFYDSIAGEFDRIMNRYDLQRRLVTVFDVLLRNVDLTGRTLLDAGCGTGWFSMRACQRGAEVTALDIGPRLLSRVRHKCGAKTALGDVLDMRFEDHSFDMVISSECIEHTLDPRQAVRELIRVCRPGGLVVITSNNRTWYWLCALANKFHWRPYQGIENWPSWSQLRRWVEQESAHIMEMRGIHLFPFQVSLLHPILKFLDRFGRLLGPLCVNQALVAVKLR
jgi:ubiquinone/menaquinone biosynthesis C-methylase UbiE